jgi:tetratricopeptide (TPR) repeat protein
MFGPYFPPEPGLFLDGAWQGIAAEALPRSRLREGIGRSHLTVSTGSAEAQRYFDQGLNLLHAAELCEARRAFAEAARQDPGLAMAHWGLALSLGPGRRHAAAKAQALASARGLSEHASDLEQRLIVAATHLVEKGPYNGRNGFVRELEALIEFYPAQDVEARLFLAGFLMDGYELDGRPGLGHPYAQSLLRELLRSHPDHVGVHHAWVHSVLEGRRPEQGLHSARRIVELAPGSGRLLQSAARLLMRSGAHAEAMAALRASLAADDALLQSEGLSPRAAPGAFDTLRLLVLACADAGLYREAQGWGAKLRARAEAAGMEPAAAVFVAGTLAQLHLRFGFLKAAADVPLALDDSAPLAARGFRDGLRAYTHGLVALEAGRLEEAQRCRLQLEALHATLSEAPKSEEGLCPRDVGRVTDLACVELEGALELRRGDLGRAEACAVHALRRERRLRRAEPPAFSRPALELLTRTAVRGARWAKARETVEALVQERPGCGHARFLLADVLARSGAGPEATTAFAAFLSLWPQADELLPELKRARAFVEAREGAAAAQEPHPELAGTGVAATRARVH